MVINHASFCIQCLPPSRQDLMAEAVGLVASIIAIAGLADNVLKFVGETRHFVRDVRSLTGETERSVRRIHFAAGTINTAQTTLSTYCAAGGITSQSHVIQFIEDNATASFLESESRYLSVHVNKLKEGVYALRKRWVPVAAMYWRYFVKDQVEDLREDMEFIQVNLTLLLCCVQLEIALKREKRDEAEMQVELLAREPSQTG